ncbi:NAD-dependent protein deacylase sirtuin-5, mitochondrial [Merluccius polli]|uniref:NAD-dependent protein deacylase sirtuin-5, mitochondrial n=1 Tax=Merluccius polli TaxID=89951 RepID=A0AA47M7L2_MERPO|nr:NAD-dependent protein deacylase sirtuin-5, mitochondrial [Merluccius polli]
MISSYSFCFPKAARRRAAELTLRPGRPASNPLASELRPSDKSTAPRDSGLWCREILASLMYGVSLLDRTLRIGLRSTSSPGAAAMPTPSTSILLYYHPTHGETSTAVSPSASAPMIPRQLYSRGPATRRLFSRRTNNPWATQDMSQPSSDLAAFREVFSKAKHVAILTGAGVSAESGVPTFRGAGGYWRKWQSQHLATPEAFSRNPSRVWEFYHYRREVMLTKTPNPAHLAIAECQERLGKQGRKVTLITQNIDELHRRAGSKDVLEIHGSLFKTHCMSCGQESANHKSPICAALEGKGAPDPNTDDAQIPVNELPRCEDVDCRGLLRPAVVWFGETLDSNILTRVEEELDSCDLCLVVGTSSIVYPAAMFAPQVAARGVPVAEFNMENTPATMRFKFHFHGPCGTTLPPALARHQSEAQNQNKNDN